MSNHDTGFIKILVLLFCLGLIQLTSGCSKFESTAIEENSISTKSLNGILDGVKVFETDALAKKVFYLSINSSLIKTPPGFAARQDSFCTAVALEPSIILTAAHCIEGIVPENLNIIEGVAPWNSTLNPDKWHGVDRVIPHPNYLRGHPWFDLAVLRLTNPLTQKSVITIDSPTKEATNIILAGYGFRVQKLPMTIPQDISRKKNAGELFYISKFLEDYNIASPTFSFETISSDRRVCLGDSGGPALIYNVETDEFKLVGLLSGSIELQKTKKFGDFGAMEFDFCSEKAIYSNLKHPMIQQWIEQSMNQLLISK
jgi:secreted trypsin-like serine protease